MPPARESDAGRVVQQMLETASRTLLEAREAGRIDKQVLETLRQLLTYTRQLVAEQLQGPTPEGGNFASRLDDSFRLFGELVTRMELAFDKSTYGPKQEGREASTRQGGWNAADDLARTLADLRDWLGETRDRDETGKFVRPAEPPTPPANLGEPTPGAAPAFAISQPELPAAAAPAEQAAEPLSQIVEPAAAVTAALEQLAQVAATLAERQQQAMELAATSVAAAANAPRQTERYQLQEETAPGGYGLAPETAKEVGAEYVPTAKEVGAKRIRSAKDIGAEYVPTADEANARRARSFSAEEVGAKLVGGSEGGVGEGLQQGLSNLKEGAQSLQPVWAALKDVTVKVIDTMAGLGATANKLIAEFNSVVGRAAQYTRAFAPADVFVLNRAFYDLSAVIGKVLQPVIQESTVIIRYAGAVFNTLSDSLRGVVGSVAGSLRQVGEVLLNGFLSIMRTLQPVFAFLAQVIDALVAPLQGLIALTNGLVSGFVAVLKGLFGFVSLEGVGAGLKTALQKLTEVILIGVAKIAKAFGADSVVKGMMDALKPGEPLKDAAGMGAATNAQVGDLSSFGKELTRAALMAQGKGMKNKDVTDWAKDIYGQLDTIQKSTDETIGKLAKAIGSATGEALWSLWQSATGGHSKPTLSEAGGMAAGSPMQFAKHLFGMTGEMHPGVGG